MSLVFIVFTRIIRNPKPFKKGQRLGKNHPHGSQNHPVRPTVRLIFGPPNFPQHKSTAWLAVASSALSASRVAKDSESSCQGDRTWERPCPKVFGVSFIVFLFSDFVLCFFWFEMSAYIYSECVCFLMVWSCLVYLLCSKGKPLPKNLSIWRIQCNKLSPYRQPTTAPAWSHDGRPLSLWKRFVCECQVWYSGLAKQSKSVGVGNVTGWLVGGLSPETKKG